MLLSFSLYHGFRPPDWMIYGRSLRDVTNLFPSRIMKPIVGWGHNGITDTNGKF